MKKIVSVVMLLLTFCSNFFCFSFADADFVSSEGYEDTENSPTTDDSQTNPISDNDGITINSSWALQENDENGWTSGSLLWAIAGENTLNLQSQEPDFSWYQDENSEQVELLHTEDTLNSWPQRFNANNQSIELQQQIYESSPNLLISEVFFGSSDEWIEVYNAWDDFQWNLVLSGIYNWKWVRSFTGVFIWNWMTKIFGNSSATNVLWNMDYLVSDPTLRIWDNTDFLIELYFSWELLDSFSWNSSSTNSNTSFHRIINTREFLATTSGYSRNVANTYLANPWYVFLQEFTEPEVPNETNNTWENTQTPNLKITEIYFDWDNNWFEITNLWDSDFAWDLTLNWNLNFTISTQIPVWVSKVFANSLTMFETWTNIEIITNNISFENERIDVDLIRSGEVLDTFFVHESRVDYLQDSKTSCEKIWTWNNWTTTFIWLNVYRVFNVHRPFTANPTTYFTQWENLKDVTQDRNWTEEYTWDDYNIPINCDDFRNDYTAKISEVYFWNDTYPQYVELKIQDDISDYRQILLSGSAVTSPVYFSTRWMKSNTFVLLTNNSVRHNEWRESKENSDLNLNSSWWLILYWLDSYWEDVLDIVYISETNPWNAVYMWSEILDCAWVFDYTDKFSPWLTLWQSQFIQITPDPIIQYINVWWGWSCSSNEKPTFDNSPISSPEIQISAIKYYGDKQILKLKNKTNSDINLHEYYLQFLDWTKKNVQWNTLFAKSTMSFLWNYGLETNQDFCVNLMKNWGVVDRYCRNSLTKYTAQDEQNILNQLTFREDIDENEEWITNNEEWEEWDEVENQNNTWNNENFLQTNLIKIIDIDYDPAWSDGDNESVTLLLLTGNFVDLSGYNFYYTKDWKTQKVKFQLQWILSYWSRQIFKWWFNFPNSTNDKKSVTVNLFSPDGKIVDTYIYNPNKITEIPAGDYEVLSVIDGDTIKINYESQEFSIRFAGIDAPESSALRCGKIECFWPEAKQYLKSLIEWKTVYFEPESMDWYDRFVWYVFLNWENINEKMVKNGYAREYSYKNQTYKYQTKFKSAQNFAKNNALWLRWYECKWERLCPIDETQVEKKFLFNIEKIVYDPEWSDNWNEEIWLKMLEWVTTEFGTDFYLLVNDTKKSLKKYWSISPQETKKLVWTFWFPNNKLTTVSLVYNWDILDTYVYNPKLDQDVETGSTLSTWDELLAQISQFQILSILPNPFWADWSNEEIELFCTSQAETINLSSWFYLQIWTTKKYLNWEISTNENVNLKWSFSFPNKWWCVELGYKWYIFDKFCYTQPDEWQKFYVSNWVIESISTLDLSILKNAKLQNIGNKVCLTYAGQKFYCKNMPYSKLSTKRINQNKMYKNFFDEFEWYLKNNWKIMYYDSEIKNYFDLLNEIEDAISDWKSTVQLDWINYNTAEFSAMYEHKFKKEPVNFLSNEIGFVLPNWITDKYSSLKQEYWQYLFNKNLP